MTSKQNLTYLFIALILGVVPFIYSNFFYDAFEYPKILVLRILIELLVVYFIFRHLKYSWNWDLWDTLAISWILILVGSSWRAGNFSWSFWGGEYRHQGILTQIHLVSLFLVLRRLLNRKLSIFGLKVLIVAGILQSFLILLQFYQIKSGLDIVSYSGRPIGTFGQPGFAGGFLVAAFGGSLGLFRVTKNKKYILTSAVFFLAQIFLWSFGGVVTSFVIFFVYIWKVAKSKVVRSVYLGSFLLALTFFFVLGLEKEKITVNSYGTPRVESRLSIWPASFNLFLKRPLIGYGAENLGQVFPDKFGGGAVDRAHNMLLDTLLSGGVFLAFVYLALVSGAFSRGFRSEENFPSALAFVGVFAMGQVNVAGIVNLLLFWFLLSAILKKE